MIVYVITKGSYSDYHIVGVTTEAEHAKMMQKYVSTEWEEANIEVFDTDLFRPLEEDKRCYEVVMRKNGEVEYGEKDAFYESIDTNVRRWWAGGYIVDVWAKNAKQARKIGIDKIIEYKYHLMEEGEEF